MNHLLRELAPVSDTAWGEIDVWSTSRARAATSKKLRAAAM